MKHSTSLVVAALTCTIGPIHHCASARMIRRVVKKKKVDHLTYGVDVSFPMHHGQVSTNYAWLPHNIDPDVYPMPEEYKDMPVQPLGNRQEFYDHFIQGCRNYFKKEEWQCDDIEKKRVETSLRQTMVMKNFTDTGFKKTRAPRRLFSRIKDFWEKNKHNTKQEESGNTYMNFWESPMEIIKFDDETLLGDRQLIKGEIWNATKDILQQWMGIELKPVAVHGIRVYNEGAVLTPHVDELPRVGSAIINVAQDVDEDWPIEIIGRNGHAQNMTMHPGDMVLYESHATLLGRPFPLKGRYYTNIIVHFEPTGRSLDGKPLEPDSDVEIPPYIAGGTWMVDESGVWKLVEDDLPRYSKMTVSSGSTEAHRAALVGNIEVLSEIATDDREQFHQRDENGWMPIHEAARGGHKDAVELLLNYGADINERTHVEGTGGTPLYWALSVNSIDHPVVTFLESMGAVTIEPEL